MITHLLLLPTTFLHFVTVNRYEAVDNLWHYLEGVVNLKHSTRTNQDIADKPSANEFTVTDVSGLPAPDCNDLTQMETDQTVPSNQPVVMTKKKKKKGKPCGNEIETEISESIFETKTRSPMKAADHKKTKHKSRRSFSPTSIQAQ